MEGRRQVVAELGREKSRFYVKGLFPLRVVSSTRAFFGDRVVHFDRPSARVLLLPATEGPGREIAELRGRWRGRGVGLFHGEIVAPEFRIEVSKRKKLGLGGKDFTVRVAKDGRTFVVRAGLLTTDYPADGFGHFRFDSGSFRLHGEFEPEPRDLGEVLAALLLQQNRMREAP